tara:strand:+ start:3922 stop:4101 length:180 start_codon:yes stop_codon:yes gene_type:complete
MGHSYHDIVFTPTVADLQSAMGAAGQSNHRLSERIIGDGGKIIGIIGDGGNITSPPAYI